jgi:D-alanyl-D-alanine carboxypeptidase
MNKKAGEIGAASTKFINPHGLTKSETEFNYSTAHDLALIASHALENPKFSEIVSSRKKEVPRAMGGKIFLKNHNRFLEMYEGADGVKTGFTKKSGRCLVSSVTKNGMRFIAVTLSDPDDWRDHKLMHDFAFSTFEKKPIVKKGENFGKVRVNGGAQKYVNLVASADYYFPLKSGETIKTTVKIPQSVTAPIECGQEIGSILATLSGSNCGAFPLVAESEVLAKFIDLTPTTNFRATLSLMFRTWFCSAR